MATQITTVFQPTESRKQDNATLRRIFLAGSLIAEKCRNGEQDKALAETWDELVERYQLENTLKN